MPQPWLYPKDFSVHPRDSHRILVGACDSKWEDNSGGLYLTEDGGQTWQRIARKGRRLLAVTSTRSTTAGYT